MADQNPNLPTVPFKIRVFMTAHSISTRISKFLPEPFSHMLMDIFDPKVRPSPTNPIRGVTTDDVVVDPSRDVWFRIFTPVVENSHVGKLPLIVYYHGGGFTSYAPSSKGYDDLCRRHARELPAVIVSVNYRLTPKHKYPSQYEDGFDALKFLDENSQNLNLNAEVEQCFLSGDSAGGNLAHNVAVRASEYDFKRLRIAGLIALQPFFGGEQRTESEIRLSQGPILTLEMTDRMWNIFVPDGSDRDHPAVNVSGPNGVDLSGLDFPTTMLVVGGFDPLQDWQRRYHEWLKRAGKKVYLVEYPSAIHGFYAFPDLPESATVVKEVRDFMQKQGAYKNN